MRIPALPSILLAAGIFTSPARSQAVEIYGTFSPTHISGVRDGNILPSAITTSFWSPNVGGGVTFNVLPVGPLRLGFDFRGSTKSGTNGSDLFLGGIKLGAKLPLLRLKPYVQASGGYLQTRARVSSGAGTNYSQDDRFAVYEILGGVDYALVPFFDLRLVEVGGGRGYNLPDVAAVPGDYQVTLFTVSTGVVFHF